MKLLIIIPFIVSCESLMPHYVEYSAGYGIGNSSFDRPAQQFDTEEVSVWVTAGYMSQRYFRDVGKSNAYWDHFDGHIADLGPIPGAIKESDASTLFSGLIPAVATTIEQGKSQLYWGGTVLLIALAVLIIAFAKHKWNKKQQETEPCDEQMVG